MTLSIGPGLRSTSIGVLARSPTRFEDLFSEEVLLFERRFSHERRELDDLRRFHISRGTFSWQLIHTRLCRLER